MSRTKIGNRLLAWLCVVMMLGMMLPISGYTPGEPEYDLVSSIDNGTMKFKVDGSEATVAQEGDTVTVEVTPNTGYKLVALTADDADILTPMSFTMPDNAVTVVATIVAKDYSVSVSSVTNGTLSASVPYADAGETITVTASPAEGYYTDSLSYNDGSSDTDIAGTSFVMPGADVTVNAAFTAINYDVTANAASNGTYTVSKATANIGDTIEIENIVPDANFKLGKIVWNDGTEHDVTEAKSFSMPAKDVDITVEFYRSYTVDVYVEDTNGAYGTPTTYTYYAAVGTPLNISENDNTDYKTPTGYELDESQTNVKAANVTAADGAELALYYKAQKHILSWSLTNFTNTPTISSITYNIPIEATINAADYYKVPAKEAVTVTIDGVAVSDFTYTPNADESSAALAIAGTDLLGDVLVSANAVPRNYNLDWSSLVDITVQPQNEQVTYKTNLAVKLVPNTNYVLPEKEAVSVTVDDSTVDFDYSDNGDGTVNLTVDGNLLHGEVKVAASGVLSNDSFTLTPVAGKNGWYQGLTISPNAEGWKVSLDGTTWQGSIDVEDGEYSGTALMVYVKDYHDHSSDGSAVEAKVDTINPDVSVGVPTGTESGGKYYTNTSSSVVFSVKELNFVPEVMSGDNSTDLSEANFTITTDAAVYSFAWAAGNEPNTYECTVTLPCAGNSDGEYTIALEAEDLSGRKDSEPEPSATIVLDTGNPTVTGVAYTPKETGATAIQKVLDAIFGVFKSDEVNVTVTASDTLSPIDHFVITDSTGAVNYTLEAIFKNEVYTATTTDGIKSQYKGSLIIKAYDKAGNESTALASTVEGATVTNNINLLLDTAAPTITGMTSAGADIHTSDVVFTFTVTDPDDVASGITYSGLDTVTYKVYKSFLSEGNSANVVASEGTLYTHADGQYVQALNGTTDSAMSITIPASLNSNKVVVEITATDNAGNTATEYSEVFRMDNVAPVISVVWTGAVMNDKYFNSRSAVITVEDVNFIETGVSIVTDGVLGEWQSISGSDLDGDGKLDRWSRSVSFTEDGVYSFAVSAKDASNIESVATDDTGVSYSGDAYDVRTDFIIDNTPPTIATSYSVDEYNSTGRHFTRTAQSVSFTISDTNYNALDPDCAYEIHVTPVGGTAVDISGTSAVSWDETGKICTVTLTCGETLNGRTLADGEYKVDIKVTDQSEKDAAAETEDILVLDTVAPINIQISYGDSEPNAISRLLSDIKYHIFGIAEVKLTVTAEDANSPMSGLLLRESDGATSIEADSIVYDQERDVDGTYKLTATYTIKAEYKDRLTVVVFDAPGNDGTRAYEAENLFNENYVLDTKAPEITLNNPDYDTVHTSSYSFGITVQEPNAEISSGLNSVSYTVYEYTNKDNIGCELAEGKTVVAKSKTDLYGFDDAFDSSYESTDSITSRVEIPDGLNSDLVFVEVTAIDNAGHSTTVRSDVFMMDNTKPVVDVVYTQNLTSGANEHGNVQDASVHNGKYFNSTRTATITVTELNFDEAKSIITTENTPSSWNHSDVDGDGINEVHVCSVEYPTDGVYTFTIDVTDNGNLKRGDSFDDKPMYTGDAVHEFVIDLTDPEFEIDYSAAGDLNESTGKYYTKTSLNVSFTVVETNFVPNQEGCSYTAELIPAGQSTGTDITDRVSWNGKVATITLSCADWDDGEYTVKFSATDFASRSNECETEVLVLDDTAPENFKIEYTESKAAEVYLNAIQFGIFKEDTVNVTVTATDANSPITSLELSAAVANAVIGQKSFSYPTSRNDAGVYTATATYVVDAQYKDQLTVTVTDFPTNVDAMAPAGNGSNSNNTNVVLDTVAPGIVFNNPDYSSVHNTSYSFTFTITDDNTGNTSSGLSSVSYVVYKYNSSSMSSSTSLSEVTSYTFASGDFNTGDTYTATIPLDSGNTTQNSNLVYVVVTARDNAGNETILSTYEDSGYFFKMDNIAPVISVRYDNDSAENSKYFKETRTATVTLVDHNFSADNTTITTGGSVSGWPSQNSGTDSDGDGLPDTYTCTVGYMSDGDYTITITSTDEGGNPTTDSQVTYTGTATQDFTIDLTKPTYVVSFADGGDEVESGTYSQGTVTVTLTVDEHNFDENSATNGITVIKKAIDGTEEDISESIRNLISWSSNGDTRTATFELPDDGEYTIDMSFVDMAGNNTDEGGIRSVFVDQHDPIVKVTGIRNESANADDEIIPVVTISDKYYDAEHGLDSIQLFNGLGEDVTEKYLNTDGASEVVIDTENDTQIQTFTFNNITEDDIYRIVVVHTDLSGRQNSVMTVLNAKGDEEEFSLADDAKERFSVNRNGSTYTANQETLDIRGEYVQSATNVRIIETNVDELDPDSIHIGLTHDNNNRDLINGTDFTYEVPPAENESGWHIYEYVLNDSLFEDDGVYTITVYSEDAAGNISQNNTEEKNFEVMFIVDKTAPIYVALNLDNGQSFESGKSYNFDNMTVTINVSDNIALDQVHVFNLDSTAKNSDGNYDWSDAAELPVTDLGNGDYSFVLHEGTSAATSRQSVLIVVTDKAGNQNENQEILDFVVSSSFWVRYYANQPLFYGSIGGVVVVLGGAAVVFFRKKSGKEEVAAK